MLVVEMLRSESLKDSYDLESRLIVLLNSYFHEIDREQDKTRAIYDVAWGIFALKEIGRNYRQLYDVVRQAFLSLDKKSSEDLSDFLFDYRRAVGIALSIYLIGAKDLKLTGKRLNEICEALTENSEASEVGELIGATFLLLKYLKHEEVKGKIKELMFKVVESGFKDPAYRLIDVLYIAFFLAIVNDPFYVEILERIRKNEYLSEYIMDDPEKLALFLYITSKATNLKDSSLVEWCKERREEVAKELRQFIEENSLIPSGYPSPIDVLRNMTKDFEVYKQQSANFAKEVINGEVILDLGITDQLLLRPDLVSKIIIALYEAGYLHPFMLSKKEADVYKQIRAEIKGYRRIRKPEMIFILAFFILFMISLPITIYSLIITNFNFIQIIEFYSFPYYLYYCISCLGFIIVFIGCIWKNGQVSLQDLKKIIDLVLSFLKEGG